MFGYCLSQFLLIILLAILYVKKKLPIESVQVDWNFIKKIIFALFLILLLNNTNLLYTLLDRFMLGLKSDIYVAYYGVGQKLSDMLKAFFNNCSSCYYT